MSKTFTLYWLHGEKTIVKGCTIEDAFSNAGFGAGAVRVLDFYETGEDSSYTFDSDKRDWIRNV